MAEISKINLYGTEYTIKDSSNATKITTISKEIIVISYDSNNESIDIEKGIIV